jgi:hypothetical protein
MGAVVALLVFAVAAEAHKVPFGYAKQEIRRETASLCANTNGCVNWKAGPCRRQSYHRVDCVARLVGENGVTCQFVIIARAPKDLYELRIHHKRIICN